MVNAYLKNTTEVFNFFLHCLNQDNVDKPLTAEVFKDPYSPEVMLLLYLYSMEPPFYADLNNACRTLDNSKLNSLGPYSRALGRLLYWGVSSEAKRDDKLRQGYDNGVNGPYGSFSESFLTFRGSDMKDEWLVDW